MSRLLTPPPAALVGSPMETIGTPSLIVDLAQFEANVKAMADLGRAHQVAIRPHVKAHKSVAMAQAQMAAGAEGICCQKLSEAYPFAAAGIRDVLVSNEFVGADKCEMAVSLARVVDLSVCVDHPQQILALGKAAEDAQVKIRVLAEIDTGQARCGVSTEGDLLRLVDAIHKCPALQFWGIQAFNGKIQHEPSFKARQSAAEQAQRLTGQYRHALEERGILCTKVTGGGTGTAEFDVRSGVYNEIQPGSYVIMDRHYGDSEWLGEVRPQNSLKILTTVMSVHPSGRAILDVGLKGLTLDSGLPRLEGIDPEVARIVRVNDEHSVMEAPPGLFHLGQKVMVIPGHCDPTVNLYDEFLGVRAGRVECLWAIDARGLSR